MPIAPPLVYHLQRRPSVHGATIGEFMIPGQAAPFYTCEDEIREVAGAPVSAWKVDGATAIPAGTYRIISTDSVRFQERLPLLVDVPGFSGIRIHAGNGIGDTSGCLLAGKTVVGDAIFQSRAACAIWTAQIEAALLAGRVVSIQIVNP